MATAEVNGVRLFYELQGTGAVPLVLVHGSWDSHHDWDLVVPRLAEAFRVLTYDRRGHSQSERRPGRVACVRTSPTSQPCSSTWISCRRGWSRTLSALRFRYGWRASIPDCSGVSLRTSHRCSHYSAMIQAWPHFFRMFKERSEP